MADIPRTDSVKVTAEERAHPALQKLARALISLARWRQEQNADEPKVSVDAPAKSASTETSEEGCHEQ